jgi:peptide/nickel transport system substrate-binding protein
MSQIQYYCYEAQTIMNDIMPYVHVLYQEDAYTNRVGMEGMIAHPTGLFSDGNIFSILNFHNTTNLPAGRDGLEWIMRYFKGVNEGNPDGLLYYEATTARTTFVDRLIWETLLTVNPDNEPIPWLAEEWTVSDDGMQYNFTLRDDVCWSNGRAMTPEDVYESFYFIRDNEEESLWGGSLIEFIDNCTLDGDVISFTLDEFDAWGIYTFADLLIFPEEVYETPYNDETFQDLTNMTTKLGSGPYMLDEVEAADSPTYWKFDANPHYWFNGSLTNDGLAEMTYPRMDKFTIRVITDTSATVTALRSGDVDTTRYYWPDLTAACEPFSPAEIEIVTSASIWRKILWINNEVSPLSDDIVCKVIAYAIDYDAIVEGVEGGYGISCEV